MPMVETRRLRVHGAVGRGKRGPPGRQLRNADSTVY
jgi:hypothetical protein